MHRNLVAKLIIPLHERLLGRATLRRLREMDASQWWSPNDLRRYQSVKLAQLLRHAASQSAFYRERLGNCGTAPAGLNTPLCPRLERGEAAAPRPSDPESHETTLRFAVEHAGGQAASGTLRATGGDASVDNLLSELPLLTKDDIRTSLGDIVWHDAPGGLIPFNTGGSTGEPLQFFVDRRRQAVDQAARLRSHRWFGVDVGDRELYLWGSPIEWKRTDSLRRLRDRLFNHRLLSAFDMSPARLDHYLDEWNRFRPASLFGYPSSIALFVDHAERRRRKLDLRRLKAVFVTGEVCLPADRDRIAAYFDVPVADGYGSREAGFIAHQCPIGNHHITAENVIVEIIRDGLPVPTGDTGEIVITHLDAYAMPLIRYRTGDIGRLKPGRCACGRGLPMMDVVQGRMTDHLRLPDGTVKHALSIIYPLREMPRIRRFRVIQAADGAVTIDVVADRATVTSESVSQAVRPVLGRDVRLDVQFVDDIPALESGKHRHVISYATESSGKTTTVKTGSAETVDA